MKLLTIIILLSISIYSANCQDRGSIVQFGFSVSHAQNISGEDSTYYSIGDYGSCGVSTYYSDDTLQIELLDTSDVVMWFSFSDECFGQYCTSADWYFNSQLMDTSLYHFEYCNGSGCGGSSGYAGFNTNLKTKEPGIYRLEVCAPGNWKSVYVLITEKDPSSENSNLLASTLPEIVIFPNPATNEAFVSHGSYDSGEISIYNLQGKLVIKKSIEEEDSSTRLNISNLSSGVYTVIIESNKHGNVRKKLIISD